MRRITLAIAACAVLLAVSVVSPAIGGPSIGKVAKQAKKALKLGKKATRKANGAARSAKAARNAASAAQGTANAANSKADQALARPVVTVGGITRVSNSVTVPASDVAATSAVCPAGQRTIAGGVVSAVPVGGTWLDVASDDRTAWFGGAENLHGTDPGTVTVEAYCAPAGQATAASRTQVLRKVRRELRAHRNSR